MVIKVYKNIIERIIEKSKPWKRFILSTSKKKNRKPKNKDFIESNFKKITFLLSKFY